MTCLRCGGGPVRKKVREPARERPSQSRMISAALAALNEPDRWRESVCGNCGYSWREPIRVD